MPIIKYFEAWKPPTYTAPVHQLSLSAASPSPHHPYIWAVSCDFQQCGILTGIDSDKPVQPPFKLRHSKYPGIQFRLPCTPPGQFFMGAKLFIGTPWMGNEGVLKKILVWAMWNCMVSMPTHSEFEKGGLPIKLLISQLLLNLDY